MASVRDEDALTGVLDAFGFDIGEFLEEGGHVEDDGGTNQIDALRRDETGREEVEVVGDAIGLDRVAGIVTALYREGSVREERDGRRRGGKKRDSQRRRISLHIARHKSLKQIDQLTAARAQI